MPGPLVLTLAPASAPALILLALLLLLLLLLVLLLLLGAAAGVPRPAVTRARAGGRLGEKRLISAPGRGSGRVHVLAAAVHRAGLAVLLHRLSKRGRRLARAWRLLRARHQSGRALREAWAEGFVGAGTGCKE
jgi:hypothetical protein